MADDDQLHVVEIAALLRELTARLVRSANLDEALTGLVTTTSQVVPGDSWCAITVVRAGAPSTRAVSGAMPAELDEVQYRTGDSPALAAVRDRGMVVVPDLREESRWPAWSQAALRSGVAGVLSLPIDIDNHVIGALSVYTGEPDALSSHVQLAAMLVAEHAGLLLAAVLDRGRLTGLADDLTVALASGEIVNQAVGILMAQRGCPADEALDVLRQAAANLRIPLQEVADKLVDTIGSRSG